MFKQVHNIKQEINKGFLITDNELIYQSGNSLISKSLMDWEEKTNKVLPKGVNLQKIVPQEEGYIGLSNSKILKFDFNFNERDSQELRFVGFYIFENRFIIKIIEHNSKTLKSKCGIYDLYTNEVKYFGDEGEIVFLSKGIPYVTTNNYVGKLDFNSNEKQWNFIINNKEFYPNLIGSYLKVVVFGFQGIDKILALNIETGELEWEINTFASGLYLDCENGLLHQMMVNYVAYDLNTGELVDNFNSSEYFQKYEVETQRDNFAFNESYIFTTDRRKGNIGAFNTKTHQFDWVHHEEGVSFPGASPVVYHHPHLVIHDNKGSLHIFKRIE